MQACRRMLGLVLLVVLPAVALAACGGSDDEDGGGALTTGTGAGAEATGAADGTRTVEHAMGATEIDGTPQRVVVLDPDGLEQAIALGVRPIGTVAPRGPLPEALAAQTRDIATVGAPGRPRLAAIARLRPDLILASKARHARLYRRLDAIAPTVVAGAPAAWRRNVETTASALGKLAQAQELLDDHARRARQGATASASARGARSLDPALGGER